MSPLLCYVIKHTNYIFLNVNFAAENSFYISNASFEINLLVVNKKGGNSENSLIKC